MDKLEPWMRERVTRTVDCIPDRYIRRWAWYFAPPCVRHYRKYRFIRAIIRESAMLQEEKTFVLRINLEAMFSDDYEGNDDEYAWLRDWELRIKPHLIRVLFESLRQYPAWEVHVRNRGKSPTDEIEVAMSRDFSKPHLPM